MRNTIKCRITLIFSLTLIISYTQHVFAQTTSNTSLSPTLTESQEKILLTILGVILGFFSSLFLDTIKRKRDARKQITWDTKIEKGILEFSSHLKTQREQVQLYYKNHPVKNIAIVFFTLQNTGNREIRNQYVRLEFIGVERIWDLVYEPEPEREMNFRESNSHSLKNHEQIYEFDYMVPEQRIGLQFIVEGIENESIDIKIHYKNNSSDDVFYIEGESKKIQTEKDSIRNFLIFITLFVILPIPFLEIQSIVSSIFIIIVFIRIFLLIMIVRLLPSVSKIISDLIFDIFNVETSSSMEQNVFGNSKSWQTKVEGGEVYIGDIHLSNNPSKLPSVLPEE